MERLIDPAIADLQAEHEDATRRRSPWRCRWILLTGYLAWAKLMVLCGWLRLRQDLSEWTIDDRHALSRMAWISLAATVAATAFLIRMTWTSWEGTDTSVATLVVYLIPAQLPLTVPAGLTLGTTVGLAGRTISRRMLAVLVFVGFASSVASFLTLDWIVPTTNQAYREAVVGYAVARGNNELSFREARARIESAARAGMSASDAVRYIRTERTRYYARWAITATPLLLTLFSLAVVTRRRFGRLRAGVAGCLGIVGYAFFFTLGAYLGLNGFMPPLLAAWLPHIAIFATSVAVLRWRSVRLQPDRA
jgi:lipopolysaccharide export LptBFGC system permease protein LptF